MSKTRFTEEWRLDVAPSASAASTSIPPKVSNSFAENVRCECCLRWNKAPGKPVVLLTFSHRYRAERSSEQKWVCFMCAKHSFGVDIGDLQVRYRRYYNWTQFGHLLPKIETARVKSECRYDPPVVRRFLSLMDQEPPVEIPRQVLLGLHEWLRGINKI